MKLRKEVTELLEAGIIDQDTAERINNYYETRSGSPQNKLVIAFGILGAILTSLGIILILAHNWDDLSRSTKTIIAFLPLLLGQLLCAYTLLKNPTSTVWREASSVFLFISIGACISLISQIYNIPGNISVFTLTWMLLALPLVYIMRSSMASLLYIIGITYYACEAGYWNSSDANPYLYWAMLLLVIPHYYLLYRQKRESNFFTFHNWFIPLSVIITLGTFADGSGQLMVIGYMSLFGWLYLIGNTPVLRDHKIRNNGYLVLGSVGTVVMLLGLSFNFFWTELWNNESWSDNLMQARELIPVMILTLSALALLVYQKMKQRPFELRPVEFAFIAFIIIFLIGIKSPMAIVLTNLLVLTIGILTIREGARRFNLGVLNYGLLIVTALVICRFFDTDIGFIFKGLLFVAVGLGFFFANYWMIKRKKDLIAQQPTPVI